MTNTNKRIAWDEGTKAKEAHNYEDAFLCFSECIANEPKNSKGFTKRGEVFVLMHEYAKALYDFSFALSLLHAEKEKEAG
jgi:hypothetical protein